MSTDVWWLGAMGLCLLIQAYYYLLYYRKISGYQGRGSNDPSKPGVSVIICTRNEAANLSRNLPHVLAQSYEPFEVIVVDHNSSDETQQELQRIQDDKLRVLHSEDVVSRGKRAPLELGIKSAKYDRLLLTDVDCTPASDSWIATILAHALSPGDIVIGYGPLRVEKGLLNRWARYDNFFSSLQFLSFALRGHPYMGVGRNLSYSKTTFADVGGFAQASSIGGDDDLLINHMSRQAKVRVCLDPDAFCYSDAPKSWRAWVKRKVRHLSTGRRLDRATQWRLGLFHASQIGWYVAIAFVLMSSQWVWALAGYVARLSFVWPITWEALNHLHDRKLRLWIPAFDLCHTLYLALFAPALFMKPKRWI